MTESEEIQKVIARYDALADGTQMDGWVYDLMLSLGHVEAFLTDPHFDEAGVSTDRYVLTQTGRDFYAELQRRV